MKSAYLVIAHGSRDPQVATDFSTLVQRMKSLWRGKIVEGAYLEINQPGLREGLEACIRQGADQVFLLPLLVFPGRHLKDDIPAVVRDAKAAHPGVDFHFGEPLASHPQMPGWLEEMAGALEARVKKESSHGG